MDSESREERSLCLADKMALLLKIPGLTPKDFRDAERALRVSLAGDQERSANFRIGTLSSKDQKEAGLIRGIGRAHSMLYHADKTRRGNMGRVMGGLKGYG